jgi:broad specificity phosphatase PhoE
VQQKRFTTAAASATTTVLLVRHGHTDAVGRCLAGRTPGIRLSAFGRHQAASLVARLAASRIDAVYSSPLGRALDTARPLADARGVRVIVEADLNEADFGAWTGLSFDELNDREDWRLYNRARGSASVPGGEPPARVQARATGAIAAIAERQAGETIVIVTHAEIIRYALLHYLGAPLDRFADIDVAPASISAVAFDPRPRVLSVGAGDDATRTALLPHDPQFTRSR